MGYLLSREICSERHGGRKQLFRLSVDVWHGAGKQVAAVSVSVKMWKASVSTCTLSTSYLRYDVVFLCFVYSVWKDNAVVSMKKVLYMSKFQLFVPKTLGIGRWVLCSWPFSTVWLNRDSYGMFTFYIKHIFILLFYCTFAFNGS